ncbi:MAG: UDP-N-acetylglucosamine 2-epimerase (non-hydrolyzing) [Pseudomonadota bacterium]
MKICTVIGARPQFVKAAAVSRAIAQHGGAEEILLHTGQHYDHKLSAVFFDDLNIKTPKYNLGVGSGPHGVQTGRMLEGIEKIFVDEMPDWVVVYGDTNSTLAGAIASAKLNIPVAHVEAGLRSFNRAMPEEINRIATDSISTLLFAPSITAVKHLSHEGQSDESIFFSGDVMYDVLMLNKERAISNSRVLSEIGVEGRDYILATVHRAENTNDEARLKLIFDALSDVSKSLPVVCPLHPRTKAMLERLELLEKYQQNILFIPPVSYLDMLALLDGASLVATDSGGVQKEAFFCGKVCFTLREETEWIELVDGGWNQLLPPTDAEAMTSTLLNPTGFSMNDFRPYGNGEASHKIAHRLIAGSATEASAEL